VSEESNERLGKNEAVFRDINERIESGKLPADANKRIAFCCECAQLGCTKLIELSIADYERVRAHPRRFLLAPGHEDPDVEKVVGTGLDHVVVEKIGDAGKVADSTDPRG
jgi:hypothetical protein